MKEHENRLKALLMGQQFDEYEVKSSTLETAKKCAHAYAIATNGIAVLSDFQQNICYIHSGKLGITLGFPEHFEDRNSAFENAIFNAIPSDELLERHILELRFFHFLKSIPASEKTDYKATCLIHFQRDDNDPLPILHSTRYFHCHPNGTAWLGLCTYAPFPQSGCIVKANIINTRTGKTIAPEQYERYDAQLLSKRQIEILSLIAKGYGSKQIAEKLCLSIHTISRHRQDILSRLNVTNSTAAVEIGMRMHLI